MRKLHLQDLESLDRNVTLGFKINSLKKLHLAHSAQEEGLSLSRYVNEIVTNYPIRLSQLEEENIQIKKKLSSFESPELINLFEQCKGQKAVLKGDNGEIKNVVINSLLDLHQVMTKSFKST